MLKYFIAFLVIVFLVSLIIFARMKKKNDEFSYKKMLIHKENKKKNYEGRTNEMKDHLALALLERERLLNTNGKLPGANDSICYGLDGKKIKGCKCHPTCKTCGYGKNPVGMNQCLTCINGSDVNSLYTNGAGWCSIDNSLPYMIRNKTKQNAECNDKVIELCGLKNKYEGRMNEWSNCLKANQKELMIHGCKFDKNNNVDVAEPYICGECIKVFNPFNSNKDIGAQKCCSGDKDCYMKKCSVSAYRKNADKNGRTGETGAKTSDSGNEQHTSHRCGKMPNGERRKYLKSDLGVSFCELCPQGYYAPSDKNDCIANNSQNNFNPTNPNNPADGNNTRTSSNSQYHHRYNFSNISVSEDTTNTLDRKITVKILITKEIPSNSIIVVSNLPAISTATNPFLRVQVKSPDIRNLFGSTALNPRSTSTGHWNQVGGYLKLTVSHDKKINANKEIEFSFNISLKRQSNVGGTIPEISLETNSYKVLSTKASNPILVRRSITSGGGGSGGGSSASGGDVGEEGEGSPEISRTNFNALTNGYCTDGLNLSEDGTYFDNRIKADCARKGSTNRSVQNQYEECSALEKSACGTTPGYKGAAATCVWNDGVGEAEGECVNNYMNKFFCSKTRANCPSNKWNALSRYFGYDEQSTS